MNRIAKARRRVAEFCARTAEAQPGEVWTSGYFGEDQQGNYYETYTAGTVRILGEECPVVEYRGMKVLGEGDLNSEMTRPLRWVHRAFLVLEDLRRSHRTFERGDTAPDMDTCSTGAYLARDIPGEYLATFPDGAWVTVEYRDPHPVYAGLRNVTTGTTYAADVRGGEQGRVVGGDWIPFEQVTGVVLHDHAEVSA